MAKTAKRAKGDIGEDVTCKYLENKGYVVRERNYWKPWGEIDIVADKSGVLKFVEVKTVTRERAQGSVAPSADPRARHETVRPEENFHAAKLLRMHRAIQTYLLQHKVPESVAWEIDLACVHLNYETKKARVELFENLVL